MDKNYKGLIWTNHALERMQKRGIKQGDAWATWRRPDQSGYAKARGAWVYHKIYPAAGGAGGNQKIEVVAKQNERREWVIISVWSRPIHKRVSKVKKKPSLLKTLVRKILG